MYPVSAAYKTAIGQNVRDVRITGTITLKDNSVINITDEDIVRGSLYITEQCVAGEDIEVGNVYASEMGLSLSMPLENPYSLDGARIHIYFGINVGSLWEYVPLGYFYVTEIQRKANNVNLTALDGMLLFDIPVGDPGSSSPRNFVVHACEQAGVPLGTSVFEIDTFANATLLFAAPDTSKIKTCRDLLMWACQIMGAFARMNRQGELEIVPIKARASVKTISKAERFNSDVSDFAVKITRVSMQVGEAEYSRGTDGMTMVLEENPLMTGLSESQINQMLDYLLAQITTAVYVPFNSNFIGDPALQPGDFVTLSDTSVLGGGDVASIITHSTWRYRGPHNIKGAGKHGLVRGVQNQQMKAVSSIVAIARAAQDLALSADQSAQLIKDAIGGHVLIRQAPDETNEILIMDHPDPEQAVKIWRWNMGGLGYSDNCVGADNPDREYEIAMTMDGAINANFIKTGQLDAGVVRIGPQTTFAPGYDPSQIEGASAVGMGVDADCVGLWHFDGSLNSHKGVPVESNADYNAGLFGQALNIATGKHLKVPAAGLSASQGTINFRAKNLAESGNGSVLVDLPKSDNTQGLRAGIADDGKLFIEDAKLQFQSVETSQADFQTGTLVDVVATGAGNLELAKDGTDVTYTETSQTDFQSGTLTDVVATSAGDLELETARNLSFDGVDDYVDCGSNLNTTSQMTIEIKIKINDYSKERTLISNNLGAGSNQYVLRVGANGKLTVGINTTSKSFWVADICEIEKNTKIHLASVFDTSNNKYAVYKNGSTVASGTLTDISFPSVTGKTFIGKDNRDRSYFDGIIDDVRIWNVARTQQQIQDNMNKELVGNEAGLVGYWKLNEGIGVTAYDSAGTNHGTIYGATWVDAPYYKTPGTREKVVDISSVGANNSGSIINFAKTDAKVTNATFTRNSEAYKSDGAKVAANVPRFEPGKFGKAVLVEEGTTNSIVDPVFAVAASWPLKSRTTFKASGGWAQDTCVTLCEGSSGSGHCYQSQSLSDGQSGVMSVYVKMSDGSEPVIGYGTNQMRLVFGGYTPPVNKTYIGDGWWRLTAVITGPSSGYTGVVFYNADNTIYPIFSNIQLEKDKGYVTSFTPGTRSPETLTIPTAGVLNPQEGTVGCWVYVPEFWQLGIPNWRRIWGIGRNAGAGMYVLTYDPANGNIVFGIYDNSGTAQNVSIDKPPVGWHFFAAKWSASEMVLLIDGVRVGTITNPNLPTNFADTVFTIGCRPDSPFDNINTLIDELRIDKIARTDEEIATAYASGEPLPVDKWTTYKMDFDNNLQATVGSVDIEAALSTDGGDTYSQYNEVKSGLSIPGLTYDTDLTNGRLKIKETLYTSDVTVTPQLHSLDLSIYVPYKSSGYRYKEYDISAVGSVGSSKITWTENTPASTTLTVKAAISFDGGSTYGDWQTCTSGSAIPGLTQGMDISNARLKVQEDLATSDGTKTPQLQSLIIDVGSNVQTAYGPDKSTLTAWDSISLAWKPERLSLVVNDSEACYIENPGLPAALGSHVFIGTDRNGNNAINTLVDELRIDKVYREVNIRTAWHKMGVPFYTSEDMKQWPGYLKAETDGLKVYDSSNALRVLVGSWLKDAVRKYGIKIIDGEIYSSMIRSGSEDASSYIQFMPPNSLQVWHNSKAQMNIHADYGARIDFFRDSPDTSALNAVARITGGFGGADLGIMALGNTDKICIVGNLDVSGSIYKSGSLNYVEPTQNYGTRLLNAVEAPELKYYDSGVTYLENGEAIVLFDPIFLECIEPDTELTPWQIWVQCYGENDVYVAEVGTDYFVIKERNGGTSNNKVIWRFEAIRKNYAGIRLMEVV